MSIEVVAMADKYAKAAKKVVEPTRADLINAAKNYFASRKIMEEEGCQGISMDCLGLVGNREIDGPQDPCDLKGFHQLFIRGDHVRQFKAYAQMVGITCEHV